MAIIRIENLRVYPLMADWMFSIEEDGGANGTKVYIEYTMEADAAGNPLTSAVPEDLPAIGSSYDEFYVDCRCRRIQVTYMSNYYEDSTLRCPRKFTLTYSTSVIDTQAMVNSDEGIDDETILINSIENTGEFVTIDPNPGTDANSAGINYVWQHDGIEVKQPLLVPISTQNIKVKRIVLDYTKSEFDAESLAAIGKINDDVFLGCACGTLIYNGHNSNPVVSETNTKKHRVEMNFVHRIVTKATGPDVDEFYVSPDYDGWNYVAREMKVNSEDPIWQKPATPEDPEAYLYEFYDFTTLITTSQEELDIVSIDNVPKQ